MNDIELDERLKNIEARLSDIDIRMTDYFEMNPKYSGQWIEARLRRLEEQLYEQGKDNG